MEEKEKSEKFDTGLSKIKNEIKYRLAVHGFFGSVTHTDVVAVDQVPNGSIIKIAVKGRTAGRPFGREDIEGCHLRVGARFWKVSSPWLMNSRRARKHNMRNSPCVGLLPDETSDDRPRASGGQWRLRWWRRRQ